MLKRLSGRLIDQFREAAFGNQQVEGVARGGKSIDHHFVNRTHADASQLLTECTDQNRRPKTTDGIIALSLSVKPVDG